MSKPEEVPAWGTDQSNDTAPSSGQQETGWTVDQVDVTSYDNWYKFRAYLWLAWLNAMWDVGGTYTAEEGGSVVLSGDQLDPWLGLSGFTDGDVVTNDGNRYECTTTGVSDTTLSGGPTGTGQNIVDGTCHWKWVGVGDGRGRYYHTSDESITYDPGAWNIQGSGGLLDGFLVLGMDGGNAILNLQIPAGRCIKSITPSYAGNGIADFDISFGYNDTGGVTHTTDTDTVADPGAGWATGAGVLEPSADDGLIKPGRSYFVALQANAADVIQIGPLVVVFDFPLPT